MVDGWIEQQVHWALIDVCQLQQLQHTPHHDSFIT
jgi:hypothetical protein